MSILVRFVRFGGSEFDFILISGHDILVPHMFFIRCLVPGIIIIIIIIIRQFIRRRNMSVNSLQGRRTTYATRIKLMKIKV